MQKEILSSLKEIKKSIKEVKESSKLSEENITDMYQIISDLSKKYDELFNIIGLKTPVGVNSKKKSKETEKKTKKSNESEEKKSNESEEKKCNLKSKAVKSKNEKEKKKLYSNILTYFKKKYLEDPSFVSSIIPLEEQNELFNIEKNRKILDSKKGLSKLKSQAVLLYKYMPKGESRNKKIRAMMEKENDEYSKRQDSDANKDESDSDSD